MNTAIVPERKVPSRTEQLVLLREELAGNKAFGALRGGGFHTSPASIIHKITEGTPVSPMGFERAWGEFGAKAKVMGSWLARLKRDGHEDAYSELLKALTGEHLIDGETVPLDQTTPTTIVMFEPGLTLDVLRWGITHEEKQLKEAIEKVGSDPAFERLRERLPLLNKAPDWRWTEGHLADALRQHSGASDREKMQKAFGADRDWDGDKLWLRLNHRQGCGTVIGHSRLFGYMFVGMDQAALFKKFEREDQKRMTTWVVDLPTVYADRLKRTAKNSFWVGLHPEAEHDERKSAPFFPSRGVSNGMGAVIISDGERFRPQQRDGRICYPLRESYDRQSNDSLRIAFDPTNCFDDGCAR